MIRYNEWATGAPATGVIGRGLVLIAAIALAPGVTLAQGAEHAGHHHEAATPARAAARGNGTGASDPSVVVHDAMSGHLSANPHMLMSPVRAATAADSARAARVVQQARASLVRYRDVRVAEREGYRMFAPNVKDQPVYHFTKMGAAFKERFRFDPARPSSLLYKKDSTGALSLVGAMYTAPRNASWKELDDRVPLGVARWHLHTNMCVPRLTQASRWREAEGGRPVFGPASPIATRSACDAVDGRFLPVVFNWMVHVNVFEDDPWSDHHH